MKPFEIQIVKNAFKRCYGLQDAVKANTRGILDSLAQQTGMRVNFLITHLEQIKSL